MSERMTEERLAEIEAEAVKGVVSLCLRGFEALEVVSEIRALWAENYALRAELAEARLAAAVADGTATPEMLRDAGLLEGWALIADMWTLRSPFGRVLAEVGSTWWHCVPDEYGGAEGSTIANLRAADAAVRKLLAGGLPLG